MYPVIFQIPKIDPIKIVTQDISFDDQIQPKLMKYGSNYLINEISTINIISHEHFKDVLVYDLSKWDDFFGTEKVSQTTIEIWEILFCFGFFKKENDVVTSHPSEMKSVIKAFNGISKTNMTVVDKKASLAFYKLSDIELEEGIWCNMVMTQLNDMLSSIQKKATLIIQLMSCQTKATVDIIQFLVSISSESFIIKPTVVSDLLDMKYLVLIGVSNDAIPKIPSVPNKLYLASLTPDKSEIVQSIQSMNADLIPKKFFAYQKIKQYIENSLFGGIETMNMINKQEENKNKWMSLFTKANSMNGLLDNILNKKDH